VKFSPARLPGVWVIDLELKIDERGFFARTYCSEEFARHGLNTVWPQANISYTKSRGLVRGLHFQSDPKPEIKVVRCSAGAIFDVVVDVRRSSPTFGQWEGFELSAEERRSLYIPAGFAHGFQCLADGCEVAYLMSESYFPELARGVRWDDPTIGIRWPVAGGSVAARDATLPLLEDLS
jgi:dTDP-4-dehydrorhamnose 3,5-epimerase